MSSRKKKKSNNIYENYKVFYGIPHCHTSISTGRGSAKEAIEHAKKNDLDYLIITDHNMYLNKKYKNQKTNWQYQNDLIYKTRKRHKKFLSFIGLEYKLYSKLDINIIGTKECVTKRMSSEELSKWIQDNGGVGIINHPGPYVDKIREQLNWNKVIRCLEVGNGSYPHKYRRYYKQYFKFLDLGWKLAAINGQDNHRKNWGDTDNVTAVFSKKLSSKYLLESYNKGRTYSTESKSLKIFYSVNESIIGDTISRRNCKNLNFKIKAEDNKKLLKGIKIITNGNIIVKEEVADFPTHSMNLTFTLECPSEYTWYVANVLLDNNNEAITSPIYIDD